MNLLCGCNKKIVKIDLISDKIVKNEKMLNETAPISCFDLNYNNSFYLTGSYSGKIYLMDNKTDKPFNIISDKHSKGVNILKFLNKCENNFISGGRKDTELLLWDCRNLSTPMYSFYRNNLSNQKLNFKIDFEDKYLFVANYDGSVIVYDLKTFNIISFFYANESLESVNSIDIVEDHLNNRQLLFTATGTRHYVLDNLNCDKDIGTEINNNFNEIDFYKQSTFRIWDIKKLYE